MIIRHKAAPTLAVPLVLIHPPGNAKITHVVVGIAQEGKAGFLKERHETIDKLLASKAAVCLVDLRGTGETAADGRGRQSGGTSYSASLFMHGQTTPGVQLRELGSVMNAMNQLGFKTLALWGDSFAPANGPDTVFAKPLDVSNMPRQSEPTAALVALLGGAFGSNKVTAVYARGGLVSFRSTLDSPFCYYPNAVIVPGALNAGEIADIAKAAGNVRMEALVDGLNRRVDQQTLERIHGKTARAEPSSPAEVASFLAGTK